MSLVEVSAYDPEWPRIAGKTEFILGILQRIGLTSDELEAIRDINRPANLARPT